MIMTQEQVNNRIREVFQQEYKDIGIYRWMNRNKQTLKVVFVVGFILGTILGIAGSAWPITIVGISFIALLWFGGIDHFIIGLRFKRMLKKLDNEGISISLTMLLKTCQDILPN
jgi:O-antigen/teichoic acid export membrane protein